MNCLVKNIFRQGTSRVRYDANVAVLIHYSDQYKERLWYFKKYGLYNLSKHTVHVTIIASLGDGESSAEILEDWPDSFSVTLLEMNSDNPIPKINGYYLWLKKSALQADWHFRVDDDSITDIGTMLDYAYGRYSDNPVHLMSSPYYYPRPWNHFVPFFEKHGLSVETITHEHESSITSAKAMDRLFERRDVMGVLEETGNVLLGAGDHSLAISMVIIGVPVAMNPRSSKHFERDRLSLTGGHLAHIHYVDWRDEDFVRCLHVLTYGRRRFVTLQQVQAIVDRPLEFGRCVGQKLATVHLRNDGTVEGGNSDYEYRWRYVDSCLLIVGNDHRVSTIFDSVVNDGQETWLTGSFVHEGTTNYLRLESAQLSPSL